MSGSEVGFPILAALILVPVAGAVLTGLVSDRRPEAARLVALMFAVVTGALSIALLVLFDQGKGGFQFEEQSTWIPSLGISWHLGVDGISLFLVVLTGVLFPIAMLGGAPEKDPKPFYAWLLVLEAGCIGVFLALDLFLFFVFFEIVIVPMYFLINGWGHANRRYAAVKFFLYTMFGSAFMLVGVACTAFFNARGGNTLTFDLVELANHPNLPTVTARWLFLAFGIAFAIKMPLFPLHTWLPDAHTEAPTAGSIILAGVMLKLGTYGFVRFGLYLFPEAATYFAPLLVTLGVVGIIYGAVCATMQHDLKRLVAYSSVAHLGFIALGTFAITSQSLQGSVLQMVNHGVSTSALFLLVGWIYERRHTRRISELKGLQRSAPIFAGVFTLVMMSSIGLPGTNGFVGEFLILLGSFLTRRWWTVVAATGVILAAVYLLWAYQRVFHGTPDEPNRKFTDLRLSEGLVIAPLVAVILFFGIYPKPVLDRIRPSVEVLVQHVEDHSDYREPDVSKDGPDSRKKTYQEGEQQRREVEREAQAAANGGDQEPAAAGRPPR